MAFVNNWSVLDTCLKPRLQEFSRPDTTVMTIMAMAVPVHEEKQWRCWDSNFQRQFSDHQLFKDLAYL